MKSEANIVSKLRTNGFPPHSQHPMLARHLTLFSIAALFTAATFLAAIAACMKAARGVLS